jgi:hypothetical protein
MKNQQQEFDCSHLEIAEAVGEPGKGEKIYHNINRLENGGFIKVNRGKRSIPNKYIFVEDITTEKQQEEDKKDIFEEIAQATKRINSGMQILIQINNFLMECSGELAFTKQELSHLKFFGESQESKEIIFTCDKNHGAQIKAMIENYKSQTQGVQVA